MRLGIPHDVPVAVQQWEGLIAVNYAARAKGISRHMRVGEAKVICPELRCIHVETIGNNNASDTAGPTKDTSTTNESNPQEEKESAVDRLTQKACLERYRKANSEIMKILHKLAPNSVIEKASIDEVYIDVTAMVDAELQGKYNYSITHGDEGEDGDGNHDEGNINTNLEASPSDAFSWGSIVPGGPLDPGSEFDVRLATGAGIAVRLRGAILEKLGYTSSAGIATNKLLAKIGSALHKPNLQTVITPRAVSQLMLDLPLKKVKNFGGKLGDQLLEHFGCTTAGSVAEVPIENLAKVFGVEKARWIVDAVHGRNHDLVEEKEKPKSMLAAKSFPATSDASAIQRWIGILAAELAPRMATDEETFKRRAKTLSVHFRGGHAPNQDRTRQAPMPKFSNGVPCADTISRAAWDIFKTRCAGEALPCVRLGISAGDFAELPVQGKSAITNFFVAKKKPELDDDCEKEEEGGSDRKRPLETNSDNKQDNKNPKEEDLGALPSSKIAKIENSSEKLIYKPSAAAAAAPVSEEEEAIVLPEELKVNIAEQKRLLKEVTMLKALADGKNRGSNSGGGGSGGGGKSGNKGGNSKGTSQGSISRFFVRKS